MRACWIEEHDISDAGTLAAVAEASGAHAERIDAPGRLLEALGRARDALAGGRPAVLVCAIDTWDYPAGFTDFHRDVWGLELPRARG
jgi:thiamine pyrophosphate-dependent acetolactate synthase large subunit-like protein